MNKKEASSYPLPFLRDEIIIRPFVHHEDHLDCQE